MSSEIITQLLTQLQALAIALAQVATTTPAAATLPVTNTQHSQPYEAAINIYCTVPATIADPISGSGVFVSKNGLVLTNAHVAQYVFLSEAFPELVHCVGRTGAPAKPTHRLETVLLPLAWVEKYRFMIRESSFKERGEQDFAFLRAIPLDENTATTTAFFTPTDQYIPKVRTTVTITGYPSGLLKGVLISSELWPLTTQGIITRWLTFGTRTVDMYELTGSLAAQKGASGSAVIDPLSNMIALVTTADLTAPTLHKRSIRALSTIYIANQIKALRRVSLQEFLATPPETWRAQFLQQDFAILQALYQEVLQ